MSIGGTECQSICLCCRGSERRGCGVRVGGWRCGRCRRPRPVRCRRVRMPGLYQGRGSPSRDCLFEALSPVFGCGGKLLTRRCQSSAPGCCSRGRRVVGGFARQTKFHQLLHGGQAARRLAGSFVPPRDTGRMWSTCVASVRQPSARIWHRRASRVRIIRRTVDGRFGRGVLVCQRCISPHLLHGVGSGVSAQDQRENFMSVFEAFMGTAPSSVDSRGVVFQAASAGWLIVSNSIGVRRASRRCRRRRW